MNVKFTGSFLAWTIATLSLGGVAMAQTPAAAPVAETPASPRQESQTAPTEDELTLEQSIIIALTQNGDTRSANRSFESARQNVKAARSGLFPQVNGSVDYGYSSQRGTVTTINNGTGGTGVSTVRSGRTTTGISLSQNIFDTGRVKTRVRQAEASAVGAAGSVGSTRNALAFEVAQGFYEQLRQNRLVTQREGQVSLAQSQLELVQAQYKAGTVARSDIQSVQVNVSQAKLDLSTAKNDLRIAQTNFRNSLGLERGAAIKLHDDLPASALPSIDDLKSIVSPKAGEAEQEALVVPLVTKEPELPVKLDPLDDYVALADRLRPDIVQAKASVQSAQAAVKLAKIDSNPQVTANAGYTIDPRDTGTRGFTFSTGLSIPIFDAGGLKAGVRSAQGNLEASQISLDQTKKDVAADVETAYIDIVGQQDRLVNAQALLEQARVNLENATAKYRAGAGIILDIVNAQTQLFNAQNAYTGILYDSQTSKLNLDRATGRFAWADPDEEAPATAPSTLDGATQTIANLSSPKTAIQIPTAATAPVNTTAPAAN